MARAVLTLAGATAWAAFLAQARREGWRVPQLEERLLREVFPGTAWALTDAQGWCGGITAVAHGASGWIGNLLVAPERRGAGHGTRLFKHALALLAQQEVKTAWLTASEQGRPLYERHHFRSVGRIVRWVRPAGSWPHTVASEAGAGADLLRAAEVLVWGGERQSLLAALCRNGRVLTVGGGVGLLQDGRDLQLLGPWLTPPAAPDSGEALLALACRLARPEVELAIDVLDRGVRLPPLAEYGFVRGGSNLLMARGPVEVIALSYLTALASLGSIG